MVRTSANLLTVFGGAFSLICNAFSFPVSVEASKPNSRRLSSNPPFGSPVDLHGALHVLNGILVDKNSQPVQLKGMSLNWSNTKSKKYFTAGVVNQLVDDWRVDVIRAPLGIPDWTITTEENKGYLVNPALEKAKIVTVVDACIAKGLYVIVDWHDHHAEDHLTQAKTYFGEMAQTYGHLPNIIWETYNEPLDVAWSTVIKPYHEAVLPIIRQHSSNLVILGTRRWSQRVDEAANDPIVDVDNQGNPIANTAQHNLALVLHFYASTHGNTQRTIADIAINKGYLLFVSEWGSCEASGSGDIDYTKLNTWYDWMDQRQLSYANWAISDLMQPSCSALAMGASTEGDWNGEESLSDPGKWIRSKIRGNYTEPSTTESPTTTTVPATSASTIVASSSTTSAGNSGNTATTSAGTVTSSSGIASTTESPTTTTPTSYVSSGIGPRESHSIMWLVTRIAVVLVALF